MLTDTHCHVLNEYYDDKKSILDNAKKQGVLRIINAGYNMASSLEVIEDVKKYDNVYGVVGLHPENCLEEFDYKIFDNLPSKIVGIGEIGLDYYWDDVPSDKQKEIFQQQVDLAKKHQKPIIIHCRDAYEDTYEVLKRNGHPGIMHCYSGSVEMAKRFIDLGFYISLAGPVTFKNARVPKDVAEKIGLEHLLIETDCPYLTPHPYRGSLNEPANVVYIAQEIAKLKNMEIESVASQTTFNAKKVFGIK